MFNTYILYLKGSKMALILIFLGIVVLIVFVFLKSDGKYVNKPISHHKKPETNSEIIRGVSLDQRDINGFGTHYLEDR
jgi:hypothetical protein